MEQDKILFIDDQVNVLRSLRRLLRREPYDITVTDSAKEALEHLRTGAFAVIVSDQRMPLMQGTELLEQARDLAPNTVRIILTGYTDIDAAIEAINKGAVSRFLTKPWKDEELLLALKQAVEHHHLITENQRLQQLTQKQNEELIGLNENLEKKVEERTQQVTQLNQQLEKSFLGSVQIMATLSEMSSPVIGSHAKRVASLCRDVAQKMEIKGQELIQLFVAATLHDIGKVGLDTEALQKSPQSCTPREQEIIQSHVVRGEAILGKVQNLEQAAKLIRHHHENFDGTGYPDHLISTDIPLGSRIIATVNAYDHALNNPGNYRSTTPGSALNRVQSVSGKTFDPEVVNALSDHLAISGLFEQDNLEIEMRLQDLRSGMVLSRELKTARGVLLLQKDSVIQQEQLERIRKFQETDPITEGIFIYRHPPEKTE